MPIDYISPVTYKSNGQTITIPTDCTLLAICANVYSGIGTWWKINGIPFTYSVAGGDGGKLTGYLTVPNLPVGPQVFTTDGTTTYGFMFFKGTISVRSILSSKFSAGVQADIEIPTKPNDLLFTWTNGSAPALDLEDSVLFTRYDSSAMCIKKALMESESVRLYGDGSTTQGGYLSLIPANIFGNSITPVTENGAIL